MIRRAPALVALLAALMLPSAAALAQDYEEIPQVLESGMYVQLGGVGAIEQFDEGGKNSGGLDVIVGLRVGEEPPSWGAVEAQFEWLEGMEPDGNTSGDDWTTTFIRGAPDAMALPHMARSTLHAVGSGEGDG